MTDLLWRLLAEEHGHDLIEYGLLAGFIGSVGAALFPIVVDQMSAAYTSWVSGAEAVWEPCPPAPTPCS
jgi:Flp pilus assembly pilin Flp